MNNGKGNGAPLQYSCLENPMDGGAWWAAVHEVAKLDTTEQLHFHFLLSCIGEGNGNPLQCSCLGDPRDRGAWWATIYGVTQSRTRLKWLSNVVKQNKISPAWIIFHVSVERHFSYQYSSCNVDSFLINLIIIQWLWFLGLWAQFKLL